MKIHDFYRLKTEKEKICMVTCYDYSSASLLAETDIDCILVGDSVAMVVHGFTDTLSATVPMIATHVAAVSKGAKDKFIIGDLPFLSYRKSQKESMKAVEMIMQSGAHAIKLEGAKGNLTLIRHLVESGVPVMGHLGLTPQFVHQLGGFKVQGKTVDSAKQLAEDAFFLQEAGCFSMVLECVPRSIAAKISKELLIPTIGIGAGPDTDGQVLVWQDLLGITSGHVPKFVKPFLDGSRLLKNSINEYISQTKAREFPNDQHCYHN